jgi:FtsH-binding integral membrane protein
MYENSYPVVFESTQEEKAVFYKKTYLHVALSILTFIALEGMLIRIVPQELIMSMMGGRMVWMFIIGGFWLLSTVATKFAASANQQTQYAGLGLYILIETIIFLPLLYMVMYMSGGGMEVLTQAAIITLCLFGGLTAVAFMSKKDFSFLRTGIVVGGFIALGLILVGMVFGFNLGLWFSVGMVVLAGASILYQTSNIIHRYSTDQYVGASLELFSSIMLLFWYVLRILSSRR